jgi:hypothetical protein
MPMGLRPELYHKKQAVSLIYSQNSCKSWKGVPGPGINESPQDRNALISA